MKQVLKLKQNDVWTVKTLNLKNKKKGCLIESGEYQYNEQIYCSYQIKFHKHSYPDKPFIVRITLNVIHHEDGYYHNYQIVMFTSFSTRYELLDSGLDKILNEIETHIPYFGERSLLRESTKVL